MTVAELIERLKEWPGDAPVGWTDPNFGGVWRQQDFTGLDFDFDKETGYVLFQPPSWQSLE